MFETKGKVGEAALREMSGTFLPLWYKLLCTALGILMALLGLYLAVFGVNVGTGIFYIAMGVLLIYSYRHRINQIIRIQVRRMAELGAPDGCEYMSRFEEDGVYVENRSTQGNKLVPYDVFRKLYRTKNYLVLVSKSRQAFYVFRSQLDEAQERALIEFLQSKPTGIKKW